MKKRILSTLLAAAMLMSLCACAKCEHQWAEPTCTAAATCLLCGDTEGETAAHSYGKWSFAGEEMTHACTVCGAEESQPIDYQLYLNGSLEGNWDFYYVTRGDETVTTYSSEPGMYMRFGSEGMGTLYAPNPENGIITQINAVELFAGFMSYDEQERCFILMLESSEGQFFPAELYLADGLYSDIMGISLEDGSKLFVARNEAENEGLSGTWAATKGGKLYSLELMPDSALNISIGDLELQGVWSAMPAALSEGEMISGINIIYPEGEAYAYSGGFITLCDEGGDVAEALNLSGHKVTLKLSGEWLTLTKLSPEEAESLKAANSEGSQKILGTWGGDTAYISVASSSYYEEHGEYRISFNPDGSFTSNLAGGIEGTWSYGGANLSGSDIEYMFDLVYGSRNTTIRIMANGELSFVIFDEYLNSYSFTLSHIE